MNLYRLGVCLKCRGDLAYDYGDWICLQCGAYYYTGLYPGNQSGGNQSGDAEGDGLIILRPAPNGTGFSDCRATGERLSPAAD